MEQKAIHSFVKDYFRIYGADILFEDNRKLQIQLTEELDQELMNRPFYWQYIKKLNQQPQPLQLTLYTDGMKGPKEQGEPLHFGSPRLHQLFQSAKSKGKTAWLYEQPELGKTHQPVPLYPWLVVNIKVSYLSHQQKDVLLSFGLQLIHGQIVEDMMEHLRSKTLHPVISERTFPMKSLIQLKSGLLRIKKHVEGHIAKEPSEWADLAYQRMAEELHVLEVYYENSSQSEEEYEQEKAAIEARYKPNIGVQIINCGLFYLKDTAL
ncbi:YqhG family protein [Alteribacillus iranensis]|uniref:YqhG n=1 Tax=Alteribacillus iranensis TaxID=930128 RepID=A0A1I1ZF03_9BACI|nr:YqhG family protein [Alteribacillus iranensis]SFE30394.1 protein YqhG of unknown function [Alteribacillus iranensis]